MAAKVKAATEAAELVYDIVKDGIKLIWEVTDMEHKPYVHMINFALDSKGVWQSGRLQDGDEIKITRKPKGAHTSEKQVSIVLKQPKSKWWKAVTVHTRENTFKYEIVYSQDSVRENRNNVEYRELLDNFVVLSKAKTLGAHTNMYWIQNSYDMGPDYEWEITWQRDWATTRFPRKDTIIQFQKISYFAAVPEIEFKNNIEFRVYGLQSKEVAKKMIVIISKDVGRLQICK